VEDAKDMKSKWKALRNIIKGKNASRSEVTVGADAFALEFKSLVEKFTDMTGSVDDSLFTGYLRQSEPSFCFRKLRLLMCKLQFRGYMANLLTNTTSPLALSLIVRSRFLKFLLS
jgi:hypothetical protein